MKRAAWLFSLFISFQGALAGEDFDRLVQLVQSKNVKTVENFLSILPPGLKKKPILMYRSRSLQGASFESPRAILYSTSSNLTIALNGGPPQSSGNDVEIMEFNPKTKGFEFHEISFRSPSTPLVQGDSRCVQCHGTPTRPIWDSYDLWPGMYGSDASKLIGKERQEYSKFLTNHKSNSRYRELGISPLDGTPEEQIGTPFSQTLNRSRSEELISEIRRDPKLWKYRYAILGALYCSEYEPVDAFIPAELRSSFPRSYDSLLSHTRKVADSNYQARREQVMRDTGEYPPKIAGYSNQESEETISAMRLIFESSGRDLSEFSVALERKDYGFNSGNSGSIFADSFPGQWAALLNSEEETEIRATGWPRWDQSKTGCELLKKKSHGILASAHLQACTPSQGDPRPLDREQTATFRSVNEVAKKQLVPSALQICQDCHDKHFFDGDTLRKRGNAFIDQAIKRIGSSPEAPGHMPPGRKIETSEIKAYFESLKL